VRQSRQAQALCLAADYICSTKDLDLIWMEGIFSVDDANEVLTKVMQVFEERYGKDLERFLVPPPVFTELQGEFIDFDLEQGKLRARFPVEERFLNPYGVLQGGMIAAAIDNTLGPLSMLIAPPNLTRSLELKYSRPSKIPDRYIVVETWLTKREGRRLFFKAAARNPEGELIVRAQAMHWIIDS
jgi:acyl-coenzyme A thioesterase PaaI-like protein